MIRSVEHIGIAVRSIDEARGFYEAMGLTVDHVEEVPEEGVRVAFIPCGSTRFELLEPTRPDSPVAKFLEKRGPGIHHVCVESDAILDDDAKLRRSGVELLRQKPTIGAGGALVNFVHPKSTGGILLELSQPPEGHDGGGHGHGASPAR
jgi:methylmalonyl-CoA/ethylmalonyl-CoA epimerase